MPALTAAGLGLAIVYVGDVGALVGAFAGWARWLELRLPETASTMGRVWPACLIGAGLVLLGYRET